MGKWRTTIATAVVVALGAATLPARAATSTGRSGDVDRLISILAKSGIPVVEDFNDTEPITPIKGDLSPTRLVRDQVGNMALELSANGGVPGYLIDELAPVPDGLPISYLIAGYLNSGDTAGARAAKKLMGKQDYEHADIVQFPAVVLTLFTSDLTFALSSGYEAPPLGVSPAGGGPAGGQRAHAGAIAAICGALTSFVSGGIGFIYDALTFENPAPDSVADWWNIGVKFLLGVAGSFAQGLIDLAFPFLPLIRKAAGIIAAVHAITSFLVNWTVGVKAQPASVHFGVEPDAGNEGKFVAIVDAPNDIEWPDGVEECAQLLNVTLPDLTPVDAAVSWSLVEDSDDALISDSDFTTAIDGNRRTSLEFVTNTETKKEHQKGEEFEAGLTAGVSVDRTDVATAQAMLKALILNQIPEPAATFVNPTLDEQLTPLIDGLTKVIKPYGQLDATITYHKLDPCKIPDTSIDPCLVGEWQSFQLALPFPPELSYVGGTGAIMTIDQAGFIQIDYSPSGEFTVAAGGLGGTGKLNGIGTATAKTTYDESDPGIGMIQSIVASLDTASATINFGGITQSVPLQGIAAFNGSYEVKYLTDPNMIDELVFTVTTSVGSVVSVWYRTEDIQGG